MVADIIFVVSHFLFASGVDDEPLKLKTIHKFFFFSPQYRPKFSDPQIDIGKTILHKQKIPIYYEYICLC